MCLNCTGGPRVDPPAEDPKCVEIAESRAIDVIEIDGASNNGVEQVRDLRQTVRYAPASSRYKIYIIDEVHMLTTAAFNALLKTLEEPPEHVKFLFATTDPEKVLPTILSRCQRFDFRRIPAPLIVKHLGMIAEREQITVDGAALQAIARGADGGMRDAESALDQLISFCGTKIVEEDVLSMFGLAAGTRVAALANAILSGEALVALRELDGLAQAGKDLGRLTTDLLHHFRNLLVFRVSGGDRQLLEVTEAEAGALEAEASRVEVESLTRILEVLTEAEGRLGHAISKKILLEVTVLRAIEARAAVNLQTLIETLGQLRDADDAGSAGQPAVASATGVSPAPGPTVAPRGLARSDAAPEDTPVAGMSEGAAAGAVAAKETAPDPLASLWARLLEAVGRARPLIQQALRPGFPVSLDGNRLVIGFDPGAAESMGTLDNSRTQAFLRTKLEELGVTGAQVGFVVTERPGRAMAIPAEPVAAKGDAPAPARPGSPEASLSDFKNDPAIREAVEVFRAQQAEVRG